MRGKGSSQQQLIATLMDERRELKGEIKEVREADAECRKRQSELESEVNEIRLRLELFESTQADFPFPVWLKDLSFKMVYVNREYERRYLIPMGKSAKDYIGKTDYDVWDRETADLYRAHDVEVVTTGQPLHTVERIPEPDGEIIVTPSCE